MYAIKIKKKNFFWTATIFQKEWSETIFSNEIKQIDRDSFFFKRRAMIWSYEKIAQQLIEENRLEIFNG